MKTLFCVAALALCACGREDVSATLTSKMDDWGKAFNAHDTEALLASYAGDAQFIYTFEGQEGQGLEALKAFYTQSFATSDIQATRKSYEVIEVSDGIAMGLGEYEDTLTGPQGPMVLPTHASQVWVKTNGQWSVRVDHASFVPPPMM